MAINKKTKRYHSGSENPAYRHGMFGTREYFCWSAMLSRCRDKNNPLYKNYGGRGIKVCKRWMKFKNFFADMGKRPVGMSIDRIDNNGDYKTSNCRWATRSQQQRNKSTSNFVKFNNEIVSLKDLCERGNLNYSAISQRIVRHGWSVDEAISIPIHFHRKKQ